MISCGAIIYIVYHVYVNCIKFTLLIMIHKMGTTKEINIKNCPYYFYNDIINLNEFDVSKIKVDKKDFNDIDIYCLGYEHQKKISEYNVINSVNPLYLRIININGQFKKGKNDAWYLVISDKDVYKKLVDIFESIKNRIAKKNMGCCKV